MKILIAVASRHGSTTEIAARLADRLSAAGHTVTVADVDGWRDDLADFDACVVGSAVYEGHWLRTARRFLDRHAEQLRRMPVWLFSSGPVGDDRIGVDRAHTDDMGHTVDCIEHRTFAGRLDRDELGRMERWVVDMVHAGDGDFRDWAGIDDWGDTIAAHLERVAGNAPTRHGDVGRA